MVLRNRRPAPASEDSPRTRYASAVCFIRFVQSYYPREPDILRAAEAAAGSSADAVCAPRAAGPFSFFPAGRLEGRPPRSTRLLRTLSPMTDIFPTIAIGSNPT